MRRAIDAPIISFKNLRNNDHVLTITQKINIFFVAFCKKITIFVEVKNNFLLVIELCLITKAIP
jgi:hypothetical protein